MTKSAIAKFFKATHKETGETIEFDLGDIAASVNEYRNINGAWHCEALLFLHGVLNGEDFDLNDNDTDQFLKDYKLEYQHQGKWFELKEVSDEKIQ